MKDPLAVRTAIGLGPVVLACLLAAWRRPQRSDAAALVLGIAWVAAWIFPIVLTGVGLGWWELRAEGGTFFGIPVDLWAARAIACGAMPLLLVPRATYRVAVSLAVIMGAALVALDGVLIRLGPGWPVGALVDVAVCIAPAQLLGCWTRDRTHVYGRVVLQLIEFTILYLIVVTAMLDQTGGSWSHVLAHAPAVNALVIVLLGIPLLTLGWGGILEFPARGLGTPLPYDTAPRLLTSGPYAYIRNPVQLTVAVLLVGVGAWLSSVIVFVVGLLSVPISQVLSDWDEIYEMPRRYGDEFRAYKRHVRRWLPSWYPWSPRTARLYIGRGGWSELARSIASGGVRGLDVVEINALDTLRYDPCDGLPEETDVVALARVMEHRHFAWALVGILIRLPPVRGFARLWSGPRRRPSALARQP